MIQDLSLYLSLPSSPPYPSLPSFFIFNPEWGDSLS